MQPNPYSKVELIQAKLREVAAQLKESEGRNGEGSIELPVLAGPIEQMTFEAPVMENSFAETTMLDLLSTPRPMSPRPERGLDDIYERIDKLAYAANFLMTVNGENKCRLSGDTTARMKRVEQRLDQIDNKEVTVGVGKLKLTLKWSGLLTLLIALSQLNIPWIVSLFL